MPKPERLPHQHYHHHYPAPDADEALSRKKLEKEGKKKEMERNLKELEKLF